MDPGWTSKVALATAGSEGIGKGVAEELVRECANVATCARGREGLEKAADDIGMRGTRALPVRANVTNAEDIERVVDETVREFGRLDAL